MKTKIYPFSWVDWAILVGLVLAMAGLVYGVTVLFQEVSR